jgi:hypothetical protein
MRYHTLWEQIRTLDADVSLLADRQQWHNRRNIPTGIEQRGRAHFDHMVADHEAMRRMVAASKVEGDRMLHQIIAEETERCSLGAGVNLQKLQPKLAELERLRADYVTTRQHDVALSFAGALDDVDANGLIMLGIYEQMIRPTIESASVEELERRYERALQQKDARGMVEARLIEERVDRGGLSTKREDVPVAKRLADYVAGVRDIRVEPLIELHRIDDTITKARKTIGMAQLAQVRPVDADHPAHEAAKAAYQAEIDEFQTEREIAAAGGRQ